MNESLLRWRFAPRNGKLLNKILFWIAKKESKKPGGIL